MAMKRGDIWWADLGEPHGSSPGFERPILIVSADSFNRSKIDTIVGLVITSNVRLADAPGNVLLGIDETGLDRPSVVNCSQVVTLDKSDLRERLGILGSDQLRLVELGLRRVLNL
jgi:mRNA interferase MazF